MSSFLERVLAQHRAVLLLCVTANSCAVEGSTTYLGDHGAQVVEGQPEQLLPQHGLMPLRRLYMDQRATQRNPSFFRALATLADEHTMELSVVQSEYQFVADPFLFRQDGSLLFPVSAQPALAFAAVDQRLLKSPLQIGGGTQFTSLTETRSFLNRALWEDAFNVSGSQSEVYFEGGNVIATQCDGMPTVFIGASDVGITANYHRHQGSLLEPADPPRTSFEDEATDIAFAARYVRTVDVGELLRTAIHDPDATQMYEMTPQRFFVESLVPAPSLAKEEIDSSLAQRALSAQRQFSGAVAKVATAFSVPPSRVFVIDQLLFHIDLFMQPGLPGTVFVQDPEAALGTFVHGKITALNLSVSQIHRGIEATLRNIAATIERAGCEAIAVPGVRLQMWSGANGVNFSIPRSLTNAVVGVSPRTGEKLFIAVQPRNEENKDEQALQIFKEVIQRQGFELILLPYANFDSKAGAGCIVRMGSECLLGQ